MLQENDFIEVEYTGKLKESGMVFDTTDKATAERADIFNPNAVYGPQIVCLGNGHLIKGLDKQLQGKEVEKTYTITLSPEEGFGKKSMEFIQLISTAKFRKEGIQPVPGMQLNIDGVVGTIKTVTGGRTLVDFNHPLSGRELVYEVQVKKVVTDSQQKVEAFTKHALGMPETAVTVSEGKATITTKIELPKEVQEKLTEELKKVIVDVKEVAYTAVKAQEKKKEE